jgi:Gas vesicle synthesis protein GvpL/GvpF
VTAASEPGAPTTASYVYGVVRASEAPKVDAVGVGGRGQVRVITGGDLGAIVSDVDSGFVEASRDDLERHMAVLEQAAASATVVPLRFGTVMPDDDAVTEQLLHGRASEIDGLLSALDGRVELSLNGTYEEQIFGEVVAEQPEVAALRERVRDRDEAASYYDRIRLGELVATAMAAKRERDTELVLAALRPLADDVHLGDVAHERSVLNASFLVHRDRLPEFDRAAEQVAAENRARIRFRYAGPLPPYDFVGGGKEGPWG